MQTDLYNDHTVWSSLDSLRETFEGLPRPDDADHRWKRDSIGAFVSYLDQFRGGDPLLIADGLLAQLESNHVNPMLQQVRSIDVQTPNWSYLDQAHAHIQGTVQFLQAHFPAPESDSATAATKRAATMYRNRLTEDAEGFAAELAVLKEQLDESAGLRNEQEASFRAELERLDAKFQELEQQADSDAKARASVAEDELEALKQQIVEIQAAGDQAVVAAREGAEAAAAELLEKLRGHEKTSSILVDNTARNAIAGEYGTWADSQAKAALAWTVVAVVVGLGTTAGLIYALSYASDDSIQFTLYKTGIGVVGLIVAGYCARQAGEHRREERVAKRLHLDLRALEPFLRQVENPTQLRTEIAKRVFAPEVEPPPNTASGSWFRRGFTVDEIAQLINLGKNVPQ